MDYWKLFGLLIITAIPAFFADCLICGFIELLNELKGVRANLHNLLVFLYLPIWIIIGLVSYYIFV